MIMDVVNLLMKSLRSLVVPVDCLIEWDIGLLVVVCCLGYLFADLFHRGLLVVGSMKK